MNNIPTEIQPIIEFLSNTFSWLPNTLTWIFIISGAFRWIFKWISPKLQKFMEKLVLKVIETADTKDDHWLANFLQKKWYIKGVFLIDLIFSVKLPTYDSVKDKLNIK